MGGTTTLSTHFLLKDHLGSTEMVLDDAGNVVTEGGAETGRYSFDAFGLRRQADWSDATAKIKNAVTQKGYTGHEQLDEVELIHMGGRVYDPVIGRFLSADPFIQADGGSQYYNRYSYVQNNPLSLTDPSGYMSSGSGQAWLAFGPLALFDDNVRHETMEWARANPEAAQIIIAVAAMAVSVVTLGAGTGFAFAGVGVGSQLFAASVVAGAAGGFTGAALSTAVAGGTGSQILSAGLRGAAIGAISAAVTFGIGHGIESGSFGQAVGFVEGGALAIRSPRDWRMAWRRVP